MRGRGIESRGIKPVVNEAFKWTCTPQLKSFKIIGEDLAAISLNQIEIQWDKPPIVGACVLDLSKKFIFDFHYNTMKKHFNCKLFYSDTDSFVYEIRSNEFCAEVRQKTFLKISDHELHKPW